MFSKQLLHFRHIYVCQIYFSKQNNYKSWNVSNNLHHSTRDTLIQLGQKELNFQTQIETE